MPFDPQDSIVSVSDASIRMRRGRRRLERRTACALDEEDQIVPVDRGTTCDGRVAAEHLTER